MNKDKILETVGTVGKIAVRGIAWAGTSIAVVGGGLLGTLLYAGTCKHKGTQIAVTTTGCIGSYLAATAATKAVDNMLVEDFCLGID